MSDNQLHFVDLPHLIYQNASNLQTSEGQCDCACVATVTTDHYLAVPIKHNVLYSLAPHFKNVPLTTNYAAAFLGYKSNVLALNRSALNLVNFFRSARPLMDIPPIWPKTWETTIENCLKQMVTLGLLLPRDYAFTPLTESPTTLSAWLHITDRCNLRCAYCYLSHHRIDMSFETGQAAIDATFRSALAHGYQEVKLKYAGGEPTLRFSFVTELHRYAQTLADQAGLGLDGVILSNGTLLTKQMVETLKSLGMRLMISLDGLGDFHDRQRYYANGRGSFAHVEQAIELALAHNLPPDISITVSARNAAGLPALIEWVLAHDLPFSLNFYRENKFSAPYEDLRLEEEQIIAGILAAFKVIEANLPRWSLLASLVDRANLASAHLRTCSVGHSYLVFDPHGRVAKCQMQINDPVTTVTAEDPLALIRANELGIHNISVEEKEGCRDCEWKYWCTGGCPLATYRATGRYDVKSPNCNIYRTLYPQAIRLEGLRLLKYADEIS